MKFGLSESWLLDKFKRHVDDLTIYPMDWVSDHLQGAVTILAEMTGFPRRQLIGLRNGPQDLIGYRAAVAYDFYNNRFRRQRRGGACPTIP